MFMKHFCQEKYCEVQAMEKEISNYSKKRSYFRV